jgi:translocation and assembly module TamB
MKRLHRIGRATLVTLVALLAILAAGTYWALYTTGGTSLVLNRVTGMLGKGAKLEGVEGSLGGRLRVKRIVVDRPDFYARLEDVELDSSPFDFLRGVLTVHRLSVGSVELRTADAAGAARAPVSFKPPYEVRLEEGRIGTFRHGSLKRTGEDLVLKDIRVRGEGDAREWRIAEAAVVTPQGNVSLSGKLGNAEPYAVDLTGRFEGAVQQKAIKVDAIAKGTLKAIEATVTGTVAGANATALARIEPFAAQPVKTVDVHARDVDLAQLAEGAPATRLSLEAKLTPHGAAIAGPVRVANADAGPWDSGKLPFDSASASVDASAGRADLSDLAVSLAGGGTAKGKASMSSAGVAAQLTLHDVDLAALHRGAQKTRLAGTISVTGDKAAQRFELALDDPRFSIAGKAALAAQQLDIESATVRTGGGAVNAKGTLALKGRREFRFEGRAQHFDPSAFVKTAPGDLNFAFVTSGSLAEGPAGEAKLDIAPSTYAGQPASGRAYLSGDRQRIARADVDVTIGEAHVTAKGAYGRAGDTMDIAFRAPNLSVLAKPLGITLAGSAQGTAKLTGTFRSPAGEVSITGTNLALPSNVYARELSVQGRAGVEADSPIEARVQATGVAMGTENPPTPLAERATAVLKGTRREHRLEVTADLTRDSHLATTLAGGIDLAAKPVAWTGRIESMALQGQGAFALQAPAAVSVGAGRFELGDAQLRGDWGDVHLAATRWTPRSIEIRGSTPGLQLQRVRRSFRLTQLPPSNLTVAGDWDIRATETFDGSINVRRISGDIRVGEPPLALGLRDLQLRVDIVRNRAKGVLDIGGERIGKLHGEGSALLARSTSGWEFAKDAPLDARLVGGIPDLQPLAPWLGPDSRLAGRIDVDVHVTGSGAEPRVAGEVRAVGLTVREPASGFEVESADVALRMDGRSLVVERFVAKTPWHPSDAARERMRRVQSPPESGTISAEGSVDLVARRGTIRLRADKAVLTQLPRRFLAASGEVTLQATDKGVLVAGTLKADGGWVGALETPLPTVSDDVVVIRASQPVVEDEGRKEPMHIDVQLALNDRVWFQGRGLDTRLDGNIHVAGDLPTLRGTGVIRTVGGSYNGYGQSLTIERGILTFNGPLDNPQLNVLALRKGLPVEAGVEILGTTTHPRVKLVSTPDVPEPEKLSWLVLGRGASDASPGDMGVMMAAARAMMGSSNPGSDLTKKLGIDEIKIGRADSNSNLGVLPQSTVAGRTGTPSASEVVSVGKRLTRDVQLTFEQGLADAEGALKVTYRFSHQFQVLVRAGYLPGVDAVYRWTFE